jgi:hypothetical protein
MKMDFDDWMLTKEPKHHPTDDTVALRRLRECWDDAQKYGAAAQERDILLERQPNVTELLHRYGTAVAALGSVMAKVESATACHPNALRYLLDEALEICGEALATIGATAHNA